MIMVCDHRTHSRTHARTLPWGTDYADLRRNITAANNAGGNATENLFIKALTIGDEFKGAHVQMTKELYATSLKDPRVQNMGDNLSGNLTSEIVHCGPFGFRCQTEVPWGLASLNTYGNESLPQDGQKNFTYLTRHNGKDVNVYVLDSGVNLNGREFADRLFIGPNFSSDDGVDDRNGHGTAMASIIGSKTFGVAKQVNITSVKVFNQWGVSTHAQAMAGFQWVWEDRVKTPSKYKRSFINLSAVYEPGKTFDDAIFAYYTQRMIDFPEELDGRNLVVASAGNMGVDACQYSPGKEVGIIVVTAHDQQKRVPKWANVGRNCTAYAAPGHRIVSYNHKYELSMGYGTSQAAAFFSGVMASLLSDSLLSNQPTGSDYPYFLLPYLFLYDSGPLDMTMATTGKASEYNRAVLPADETIYRTPGKATPIPGSLLAKKCNGAPADSCPGPKVKDD